MNNDYPPQMDTEWVSNLVISYEFYRKLPTALQDELLDANPKVVNQAIREHFDG